MVALRRGWRWAALGLVLVLGGAVWLVGVAGRRASPAPPPAHGASGARVAAASAPSSTPARVASAARPTVAAQPQRVETSKGEVEVCGFGRMTRAELQRIDSERDSEMASRLLHAQMQQGERGMASLIRRLAAGTASQRVTAAVLRKDVQAAAEQAVKIADPAVYRLALAACRRDASYRNAIAKALPQPPASAASGFFVADVVPPGPVPTACAALSLERLESLDPASAWVWTARLEDSLGRGDPADVADALYQFAQHARTAPGIRPLTTALAEVSGLDPTPEEAAALVQALGMDMAAMDIPHSPILRACRAEALRDANRRQLCEQAARRLPQMTTELVEAGMLYALEQRLGLQHSAQAVSRAESERIQEALSASGLLAMEDPSCAGLSSMGRQLALMSREGELAYARTLLKSPPASAPR